MIYNRPVITMFNKNKTTLLTVTMLYLLACLFGGTFLASGFHVIVLYSVAVLFLFMFILGVSILVNTGEKLILFNLIFGLSSVLISMGIYSFVIYVTIQRI